MTTVGSETAVGDQTERKVTPAGAVARTVTGCGGARTRRDRSVTDDGVTPVGTWTWLRSRVAPQSYEADG